MRQRRVLGALGLAALAAAAASCKPQAAATGAAPTARHTTVAARGAWAGSLPGAVSGFSVGALETGAGWVRRSYARGGVSIGVTVAERPVSAADFEAWVRESRDYPAVALDVPAGEGTGFYTCAGPGTTGACDLHIQLRAGYHVEVMGGGHAARADLDDLLRALPLRALATRPAAPPPR